MKDIFFFLLFSFVSFVPVLGQKNQQYMDYIEKYKYIAVEQMKKYQIPASITLAQGIFESGAGKSDLALMSNNHFGIKCGTDWRGRSVRHDDDARKECFRAYDNVSESYEDHSKFLRNRARYAQLFKLNIRDYKGWAHGLKSAGYATNPQYANRLITLIETYQLYKYDDVRSLPDLGKSKKDERQLSIEKTLSPLNHSVYFCNDVPYVLVRKGDTLKKVGHEFRKTAKELIKYNELYDGYVLHENERIYLSKKKKHASKQDGYIYIVQSGDSMHSISQKLGIQLKKLYKLNEKSVGNTPLAVGTILRIH